MCTLIISANTTLYIIPMMSTRSLELIFKQIRHTDLERLRILSILLLDEDNCKEDGDYAVEESGDSTDSVDEIEIDTDYTVDSEIAI